MAFWIGFGLGVLIGFFIAIIAIALCCMAGRPTPKPENYDPAPEFQGTAGYHPGSLADPRD